MHLGISSYTYAWAIGVLGYPPEQPMSVLDLLHKAKELEVDIVQIADNLPLDEYTSSELDVIEEVAHEIGISVEIGARGIDADYLRNYLSLTQRFGSPILRLVIDTAFKHPSEEEVVEQLRTVMPDFVEADVSLAIENHDRFSAESLRRIVNEIGGDHIGICLDTTNSFGAAEGPKYVVEMLGPWVINLHVKDFVVQRVDHKMGFIIEGRPAGKGQLDIPWLLEQLCPSGRKLSVILELWTPKEATVEETIAKESEWASISVEYVREVMPG
jgi:sugar phosphate isomerase/epimerase